MGRAAPQGKTRIHDDGTREVIGRNANGADSVFWDRSKDRWRATYYHPTTGQRRSVLGRTRVDAERRRREKVSDLELASPVGVLGNDPTIAQLVDWFLDRVADVRPNTLYSYRAQCRPITTDLGPLPVRSVTVEHLRIFLGDLRSDVERNGETRKAYSDHTVTNIRARLRQVLEEAVTLGYLDTNPVVKVKAPRGSTTGTKKRKTVLTAEQCQALVTAAQGHHLGAAVAMLFTMGNRASEVLGLAWSDIDLDAGVATVRRGSTHSGKGIGQRLGPTKTKGTQGEHHLPPVVVDMLRRHKQRQDIERERAGLAWKGPTYEGEELDIVFSNEHGGLIYSHRLYRALHDCCDKAAIPRDGVGTHTGRRSVITALFGAGLDLADVANHVGHSQLATTAGYVQHLSRRPQLTAEVANNLLVPKD